MESRLADSFARRRFAMLLLGAFAALAVTLAAVGLYGVMSYTVSQRRGELGVRAAVGASAASLLRLVMADGLLMTIAGAAMGLVLAAIFSSAIASMLFEIGALHLPVYAGVAVVLILVAALACAIPALRAARIDPVTALRAEWDQYARRTRPSLGNGFRAAHGAPSEGPPGRPALRDVGT